MPTETDLAYIAGFFDGEGHCGLTKSNASTNSVRIHVVITNTNRDALMWIYRTIGLGMLDEQSKGNLRHKKVYDLRFPASHRVKFLKLIQPFLKIKKRQVELMLEFCETCKAEIPQEMGTSLTTSQIIRRNEIIEEFKALNTRGM